MEEQTRKKMFVLMYVEIGKRYIMSIVMMETWTIMMVVIQIALKKQDLNVMEAVTIGETHAMKSVEMEEMQVTLTAMMVTQWMVTDVVLFALLKVVGNAQVVHRRLQMIVERSVVMDTT
jgi:hypothetical protein